MARWVRLAIILVLAAQHPALAQSSTGGFVGVVVDIMTGEPVAGALVSLIARPAGVPPPPRSAQTNTEGLFVFVGVPEGRWRVQVQKSGFFVVGANGQAPEVEIRAASVVEGVIQVDRGGAIAGRMVDAKGSPVSEVFVTAVPRIPSGDRAAGPLPSTGNAQTNDLGEFRLSGLPPGEYYLVGRPRPLPTATGAVAIPVVVVQSYYPGVADQAQAAPLVVTRGVTTSAPDWRMLAIIRPSRAGDAVAASPQRAPAPQRATGPRRRVSGVVLDPDGRLAPGARVELVPVDPQTVPGAPLVTTARPDGTFLIGNVPAGTYLVDAMLASRLEASRVHRVVVENADVTGLTIAIVR
ncbi:MAG TPA: carboxypeptidase-like regulatory domain-containing protein [Vicinamibacterales bacterium]|jgi:hypothetical protein